MDWFQAAATTEGSRTGSLREYQEWVKEFDLERGWDLVPPSATCAHLMEEVGEVARVVLQLARYKPASGAEDEEVLRRQLAEELADAVTFLVKLAYTFDIDLEMALWDNRSKCESRFTSIQQGRTEAASYLDHEMRMLARLRREFESRWSPGDE